MILHAHEGKARREADEWASMYRALVHVLKRTDLKRPLYIASIDGRVPELGEWESIPEGMREPLRRQLEENWGASLADVRGERISAFAARDALLSMERS